MNIVQQHKEQFEKILQHLKQDMGNLRTGRATPALVEDIPVEAYGTKQPVKAVGSISVLDAKTLTIECWDKSLMQAVEIGIRNSPIGINPVNDGKVIRVSLPELSHERRQELVKVLHQKLEHARIALRQLREEVKKAIETAEKNSTITEDEKFSFQEDLDGEVKEYNEKVKQMGEEKEKEITTV